jgi:hypothetical protein
MKASGREGPQAFGNVTEGSVRVPADGAASADFRVTAYASCAYDNPVDGPCPEAGSNFFKFGVSDAIRGFENVALNLLSFKAFYESYLGNCGTFYFIKFMTADT